MCFQIVSCAFGSLPALFLCDGVFTLAIASPLFCREPPTLLVFWKLIDGLNASQVTFFSRQSRSSHFMAFFFFRIAPPAFLPWLLSPTPPWSRPAILWTYLITPILREVAVAFISPPHCTSCGILWNLLFRIWCPLYLHPPSHFFEP